MSSHFLQNIFVITISNQNILLSSDASFSPSLQTLKTLNLLVVFRNFPVPSVLYNETINYVIFLYLSIFFLLSKVLTEKVFWGLFIVRYCGMFYFISFHVCTWLFAWINHIYLSIFLLKNVRMVFTLWSSWMIYCGRSYISFLWALFTFYLIS